MANLLVENIKNHLPEVLEDTSFKSGYSYAKNMDWFYRFAGLERAEILALNYLRLFQLTDNIRMLGMAAYMLDLAAEHNKKEEVA